MPIKILSIDCKIDNTIHSRSMSLRVRQVSSDSFTPNRYSRDQRMIFIISDIFWSMRSGRKSVEEEDRERIRFHPRGAALRDRSRQSIGRCFSVSSPRGCSDSRAATTRDEKETAKRIYLSKERLAADVPLLSISPDLPISLSLSLSHFRRFFVCEDSAGGDRKHSQQYYSYYATVPILYCTKTGSCSIRLRR